LSAEDTENAEKTRRERRKRIGFVEDEDHSILSSQLLSLSSFYGGRHIA